MPLSLWTKYANLTYIMQVGGSNYDQVHMSRMTLYFLRFLWHIWNNFRYPALMKMGAQVPCMFISITLISS